MNFKTKDFILFTALILLSSFGFMLRLPSVFRHHDRELHFLFYFVIALFLNLIYAQKNIKNHFIIFFVLLCFGIGIEFFQEISNKLLHRKIHGDFDPIDLIFNITGLLFSSMFWFFYLLTIKFIIRKD